jgi:SufS family cysteine desulfurase
MMLKTPSQAEEIKKAFPFFEAHPDLVYLDTAATAQKPLCVLQAMNDFMIRCNGPVHRAAYQLSFAATERYERARQTIAEFIGSKADDLIFTKGATEALNLIASGLKSSLGSGDEILILETEHHANLLPWQQVAGSTKAKLVKIPVLDTGHIDCEALKALLNPKVKIVALAHMSNVTGCIQNLEMVSSILKNHDCFLIVDGAQGICHDTINVTELGLDAYVFSSHKLYGPTGLGVLHASSRLLAKLDLYQVGGDVIESVSFDHTIYKQGRARFEAGTPMVTEVIGLEAALKYLSSLDLKAVHEHEKNLVIKMKDALKQMPGIHLLGSSDTGLVSFYSDYVHALDLATYCDSRKVAIRSGHLCAQPALMRFHTSHAARISCGIYTLEKDVDRALSVLEEALVFFS